MKKKAPAPEPKEPTFVSTWDELAALLGVTRRAIQDWRHDPRYAPEILRRQSLLDRADGRHCVREWRQLMVDLNLKRGKAAAGIEDAEVPVDEQGRGAIQPPRYGGTQNDWTKAKIAKEVERRDIEINTLRGNLLSAAELEIPLGTVFAAMQNKSTQFPTRVARYLVGLRDVGEIEDKLRDEIDADLADMRSARYLTNETIASIVESIPFDQETERLFAAVTFDGQDRTTLLQLITHVANEALRRIGRRAIADALHQRDSTDTAIADDTTGQVTDEAATREHSRRVSREPASAIVESPRARKDAPARKKRAPKNTPAAAAAAKKAKSRSRRQPATGPGAIEALVTPPAPATRRRRR